MSRPDSFLQQGVSYGNAGIISASELQRLQTSMYPSDIPNLAGNPFSLSEDHMWAPHPTTLPTINPSCIAVSGANDVHSYLTNHPFDDLNRKQGPSNRRRSSAETELDQGSYRVRHGQVTPPSDHSPGTVYSVPSHDSKSAYLPSTIEGSSESPPKRRRSGSSNMSGSRGSTRASTSVEPTSPGDDKQEKTRARNRLAASKCRQKKKEQNHMLETRYEQEKMKNEELTRTVNSLRDAIVVAKDQLLAHSECGHESIKAYIQNMAKNISIQHEQFDFGAAPAQYGCHSERKPSGFGFDVHPPTA
ncbi:bZIP transcription factor atfB [Aspergillus foveolatus]|uniref:bZIP transcription factor atfB n=1 Tax=Aspergillus foveolatus TaxID=210207 RepID=UPI003CCE3596